MATLGLDDLRVRRVLASLDHPEAALAARRVANNSSNSALKSYSATPRVASNGHW